ncbi:MAG: helix-turn-helix transcriptional regulator, partial [Clostridia bacterium]|nr:helix-turn-helix transcriptional regulator [Clostridia bacterium]
MERYISIFNFDRAVVNGAWELGRNAVVNRLYYVNSGVAIMRTASKEYTLKEGYIYLFPQCSDLKTVSSENFDHTYFNFMSPYIIDSKAFVEIEVIDPFLKNLIDSLNIIVNKRKKYKETAYFLLEGIFDYIKNTYGIPLSKEDFVAEAVRLIHHDFSSYTVKDLAEKLNINEHHFIRTFKKTTGITPMKYIRSCRLSKALILLRNGMSVREASEECGLRLRDIQRRLHR